MKIAVFGFGKVGLSAIDFLISNHKSDLAAIITIEEDPIFDLAKKNNIEVFLYKDIINNIQILVALKLDLFFLAWWPKIVSKNIIDIPKIGVINFHPSLLPYNRGKNYNFWTLVDKSPFGVTLHFVNEGIDTGDIIFQKEIEKTWEDNGETLYDKAQDAILTLFKDSYSKIKSGDYVRKKQNLEEGSFRLAREMNEKSEIDLEKYYLAEDLLNLLRARTFTSKPGCYFYDGKQKFEISLKIKKI